MRSVFTFSLIFIAGFASSQGATTPKSGSAERKAILDAIRPRIERDLKLKVKFEVHHMKVSSGFAFVMAQPILTNGKRIDWRKTKYAQAYKDGYFGQTALALLKKSGKSWRVLEYEFGGSHMPAVEWVRDHHAPKSILP